MKVQTAVLRVWDLVNHNQWLEADHLLRKYQRRFGHRHFNYRLRVFIANGLWEITQDWASDPRPNVESVYCKWALGDWETEE